MPKQPNLQLIPEWFTYEREKTDGTNFGYFALSEEGHRYYLKFPSIDSTQPLPNGDNQFRSYCEVVAAKLAQQVLSRSKEVSADIVVPDCRLVRVQHEQGAIYGVASEFIPDLKQNQPRLSSHHRALIFTLSAWLNDWDRPNNLNVTADHRVALIDFGGALDCQSSPQRDEAITKTQHYGFEAFPTKIEAFKTMRDPKSNPTGHRFTQDLTNDDFRVAAQCIVDLTDTEIEQFVKEVFEDTDSNVLLNPTDLINTLIRRKYDLAHRLSVVPKELRCATFPAIANFILKTYYYHEAEGNKSYKALYAQYGLEVTSNAVQRMKHGLEHAARTALYIDILVEFLRKRDYLPAVNLTPEMIQALKIAAIFCAEGISGQRSTHNCYQFLLAIGTEPSLAKKMSDLIPNKENYYNRIPIDDLSAEELCGVLLHQAYVIDIMRSHHWKFDPRYLRFFNRFVQTTPIIQLKDPSTGTTIRKRTGEIELSSLLDATKAILIEMGDCPQEGSLSFEKKEEIRASKHPFQIVDSYFERHPVCQRYLKNGVTALTPQKTEQPRENQKDQIDSGCMTTDISVPQIGSTEGSENLPYGEYYTSKKLEEAGLQRHQSKLLLAKGCAASPETLRQCGGFHPYGIMLTEQSLRSNCLDVLSHRKSFLGSGAISTTKSLWVAKNYSASHGSDTAHVYLIIAPEGSISDTPKSELCGLNDFSRSELEYTIPGGVDFSDIIAWRSLRKESDKRQFQGNLYIKDDFLAKYPEAFIQQVLEFLLNPDETLPPILIEKTNNPQKIFEAFLRNPSQQSFTDYMTTGDQQVLITYCQTGHDISKIVPLVLQLRAMNYLEILLPYVNGKNKDQLLNEWFIQAIRTNYFTVLDLFMNHISTISDKLKAVILDVYQLSVILKHLSEDHQRQLLNTLQDHLATIVSDDKQLVEVLKHLSKNNHQYLLNILENQNHLVTIIQRGMQLSNVLAHLSKDTHYWLLNTLHNKNHLVPIIQTSCELDWVLKYLSQDNQTWLLHTLQNENHLVTVCQTSPCLGRILSRLTEENRQWLLNILESHLAASIIQNGQQLSEVLPHLSEEKRQWLLNLLKDHLGEIIQDGSQLRETLQHLSEDQRQWLLDLLKDRLTTIIRNGTQLGEALEYLSENQRQWLFDTLKDHLTQIIEDPTQFGRTSHSLSQNQFQWLFNTLEDNGHLKKIMKDYKQLCSVLQYLSQDNFQWLVDRLEKEGTLIKIIQNDHQLEQAQFYLTLAQAQYLTDSWIRAKHKAESVEMNSTTPANVVDNHSTFFNRSPQKKPSEKGTTLIAVSVK